jgi:tRNA G26 N,N-dimethylase Trm1
VHDLEPGVNWYADSEYVAPVLDLVSLRLHKGTFRHRACQAFDCKMCPTISLENDFRMRVLQETEAEVKRGSRVCIQGINFSYLQRSELIASIEEWKIEPLMR